MKKFLLLVLLLGALLVFAGCSKPKPEPVDEDPTATEESVSDMSVDTWDEEAAIQDPIGTPQETVEDISAASTVEKMDAAKAPAEKAAK